jgi:predicted ATPase
MLDRGSGHIMVIGAYRDTDVAAAQPVRHLERQLSERGVRVENIALGPLEVASLEGMIDEMLPGDGADIA